MGRWALLMGLDCRGWIAGAGSIHAGQLVFDSLLLDLFTRASWCLIRWEGVLPRAPAPINRASWCIKCAPDNIIYLYLLHESSPAGRD